MKYLFPLLLALLGLAGCSSPPEAPEAPPAPMATGTLDVLVTKALEIEKLKLEMRNTALMGMIKFADQSNSEFAKGAVAGMAQSLIGESGGATPTGGNVVQSLIRQTTEDKRLNMEYALRNKELDQQTGVLAFFREGVDSLYKLGHLTMGYKMGKLGLSYDYKKYAATLGAIDSMANRGFSATSEAWGYLDKRPYFVLPAGATPVATEEAGP